MGVDIVQHLQISFDEYLEDAKGPVEEAIDALLGVLRPENAKQLWNAMASDDFQARDLIEELLPVWRADPAECERRLRKMGESAHDTYLETARRKLGWRTRFKIVGAIQSSEAEKLNLGSDTKHQLLQISVSDELLSRLPVAVSRATLLSEWAVQEATSPAAEQYLFEACNCFLYGLDTACVILCRSLSEEVLERKLDHLLAPHTEAKKAKKKHWGGWTLGSLLDLVKLNKADWGIDGDVFDFLLFVKEAGNDATHGKTVTQGKSLSCLKNCHHAITGLLQRPGSSLVV